MLDGKINIGGVPHAYTVRKSRRRTLALHVLRDGRIEVRVPRRCPAGAIRAFVDSRSAWLARTLDRVAAMPPPAGWRDGEIHQLLGEPLRLRVRHGGRSNVRCADEFLLVTLGPGREDREQHVRPLVTHWYRRQARALLEDRVDHWFPALELAAIRRPPLKVRCMRRRWGSCASHGGINFNLWLIRAPLACVDYVVVHELCHLKEFNHGPGFHALMDGILPDWRARREALIQHEREYPL